MGVAGSCMAEPGSEHGQWDQVIQGLSRQGGEAKFNLSAAEKMGGSQPAEQHGSGHGLFQLLVLGWALLNLSAPPFPLL